MRPDDDGVLVLTSTSMRWSKAILCVLLAAFLAYFLPLMARDVNGVVLAYMVIVGVGVVTMLVGAARSLRAGIYLSDDELVVRTSFSTKSWRLADLDRAESIDMISRGGPMGMFSVTTRREEPRIQVVPVFRPVGRNPVPVRGLRISMTSQNQANWLDDALHEVNRHIEAYRRAHGDGPHGQATTPR